ncbi:MAG: hypothetical protein AB1489_02405 [Acidobacteriota bacterium]
MNSLLLLIGYRLLAAGRQVKDNIFTLFILGPLILGISYLIVQPYLIAIGEGIYSLPADTILELGITAFIFLLLLAPASVVAAECYPIQSPDAYLDSLPIAPVWHFSALVLIRAAKGLPLMIALSAIHYLIEQAAGRSPQLVSLWISVLLPALLQLTALQFVLVLVAAHYRFLQLGRLLPIFAVLLIIIALLPAASSILLFPIAGCRELFTGVIKHWFAGVPPLASTSSSLIALALSVIGLIGAFFAYQRWSIQDREAVESMLGMRRTRGWLLGLVESFERLMGVSAMAQLLRDLLLTFRFFSSAVYLGFAVAILCQFGFILFSLRYGQTGLSFELAAQTACALASFALAALASALVKYQLAFLWLERSTPVKGIEMYHDKLWYARLLSLPALIISAVLMFLLSSADISSRIFLLAKMLLVWLMVSSFVGALSFEIITRPTLAIPFVAIASLSITSLTIRLWWLWFLLYPYIMAKLAERARQRTYLLLTGVEGNDD